MTIKEYPLSSIRPYANNPRKNESAVAGVAESIRRFGFKQPIVVDKFNTIVCGHTRYLAAQQLGLKTVPCVAADELSADEVRAYRLLDNKLNEVALWDAELLATELADFAFDFAPFGVDFDLDAPEPLADAADDVEKPIPESYQVVVSCEDEASQEALYERLKNEGYKIRLCNL